MKCDKPHTKIETLFTNHRDNSDEIEEKNEKPPFFDEKCHPEHGKKITDVSFPIDDDVKQTNKQNGMEHDTKFILQL